MTPVPGHGLLRSPSHSPSKSCSESRRTEVRRTESEKYPPTTTSNDRNNNESTSGPQSIPADLSGLSPPHTATELIKKHAHKLSTTSNASTTASSTATESGQETDARTSPQQPPPGNGVRRVSQFQLDSDSSDSDSPDDDASNTSNDGGNKEGGGNNSDNRTITSDDGHKDGSKDHGDVHKEHLTGSGSDTQHGDDDVILPLGVTMSSHYRGSGSNLVGLLGTTGGTSSGLGSASPTSRASPSSSVSTTGSCGTGSIGHPHHPHFHHHHQTSFEGSFDRSSATIPGSIPGDSLSTGSSGSAAMLCLNETANQSTMWLGTEDGW